MIEDPARHVSIEQVGLIGAGGAVVLLAINWMRGLVKRDTEERIEMRAEIKSLRVEVGEVREVSAELHGKFAECEAHRKVQEQQLKRVSDELIDVRAKQAERIHREDRP